LKEEINNYKLIIHDLKNGNENPDSTIGDESEEVSVKRKSTLLKIQNDTEVVDRLMALEIEYEHYRTCKEEQIEELNDKLEKM
jgi:hypothetical protein